MRRIIVAGITAGILAAGGGIAYAATSSGAPQPVNGTYACVNPAGGIDYLEFRAPIPHPCWFGNETLWNLAPEPTPTVTITVTPTVSPSVSPSSTASASPSATHTV